MSFCLENDSSGLFDVSFINEYYDYLEEKELEYYSGIANENLPANSDRRTSLKILNSSGNAGKHICEQFFSDIHGVEMDDLFTRDTEVIYGDDIHTFIDRLREGKRIMKQEGDADRWEANFELRLIALCEFAVEHDYGVRLSV